MKDKPHYYAIIPADVRYSDIPAGAKLLYGEITALCNKEGYSWAANKYFAELYGKNVATISVWIKHLIKHKFLKTRINRNGVRLIYIGGVLEKSKGGVLEKSKGGVLEKSKDLIRNNTKKINTININKKNTKKILVDYFPKKWIKNKTFHKLIKEFSLHRKQKQASLTPIACKRLANKLTQWDITTAIEAIELSLENGYTGIFEPNTQNNTKKNTLGTHKHSSHRANYDDIKITEFNNQK